MQVGLLVLSLAALVVASLALAWTFALAQRVKRMSAARGELARLAATGDIAGLARELETHLADLVAADERLTSTDAELAERLMTSVRHVGLVRFDALPGDVGEQSFAVALLDDRATGFILTSMHGRGAYRLYAKPVTDGVSPLVLTEEETRSATEALQGTGLYIVSEERRPRGAGGL